MAVIRRSLSTKVDGNGNAEILLRFNVTRDYRVRLKSGFFLSLRDGKRISLSSLVLIPKKPHD